MATETEQAPTGASPPSVEDRIANLFGGTQPALEGDDGDAASEETEVTGEAAGEQAEDDAQEPAQSDSLEEVEFQGQTYKVPKELKASLMQRDDYTRKTQNVADERRIVEAQRVALETQSAWQQQSVKAFAAVEAMDGQLAQYRNMDWASMDTDTMTRTKHAIDQIKERRGEIAQALQGAYQEFRAKLQESRGAMLQSSEAYLARNIPKWGKDAAKELSEYATGQGFTDAEMNAFDNPKLIQMAWKAKQFDALQAQKSATIKKAENAPPVLKPGAANSLKQAQAERMNFKKALGNAKDSRQKADVIRSRLERMFS